MRRTPVSESCSLKPCWIRRCFRWLWAKSSDIRPETGNRGSYVGNRFVPRSCLYAGRSSLVNLSTCRCSVLRADAFAKLLLRITSLASVRRRFGYRPIWEFLRREGLCVNHKRECCVYHLIGLSVKRRCRRKVLAT